MFDDEDLLALIAQEAKRPQPDEEYLTAIARQARYRKSEARRGSGTSRQAAERYLAATEYQIRVLKEIRRILGEGGLNGMISSGIESLERDASDVRAGIPSLPDRPFPAW